MNSPQLLDLVKLNIPGGSRDTRNKYLFKLPFHSTNCSSYNHRIDNVDEARSLNFNELKFVDSINGEIGSLPILLLNFLFIYNIRFNYILVMLKQISAALLTVSHCHNQVKYYMAYNFLFTIKKELSKHLTTVIILKSEIRNTPFNIWNEE